MQQTAPQDMQITLCIRRAERNNEENFGPEAPHLTQHTECIGACNQFISALKDTPQPVPAALVTDL